MSVVEEPLVRLLGGREFSRLLIGYSGGLDSTVLLHAARLAWPEAELVALHVDHGLQPQSHDWHEHCASVCQRLNVQLSTVRLSLDSKGNLEATARAARYKFFSDQLNPHDVLLLAHHRFDQAETILLRLVQGRGLFGMPRERALGAGVLLRPFLDISREELEEYAQRHNLSWIEDPSNHNTEFDRNYLRLRVLPALRARWPMVDVSLLDLAARQRQLDAALVGLAGLSAGLELELAVLERHPVAIQVELLRLWLAGLGEGRVTLKSLREFVDQLGSAPHRQPCLVLQSGSLRRFRGVLCYVPELVMPETDYLISAPGSVTLPHGELRILVAEQEGFAIHGQLRVMFRRGGERILVRGSHRAVKKILQHEGVPPWLRSRYPLLVDDDGIVAVGNLLYRGVGGQPEASQKLWQVEWTAR